MSKPRSKRIGRNIGWQVLSLILAFFVWYVCITLADPEKSATFKIALQLENEDMLTKYNKILQNKNDLLDKEITIQVKGSTKVIDELLSSSTPPFIAYIDLSKAEILNATQIGEYITTNVIVPDIGADVTIERQTPMETGIQLDKIIEKNFPITVTELGAVRDGYVAMSSDKKSNPDFIRIRGANITLSKINYMSIEVNVNAAEGDVVVTDVPKAYNEDGEEIREFEFVGIRDVTVTVPVYKIGTLTIQQPQFKGDPPEGFAVAGLPDWTPKQIRVIGPAEDIAALQPIELMPIDVTGQTEGFSWEYDLRTHIEKNIRFVNTEDYTAVVTVNIEPEMAKSFVIPVSDLTVNGGMMPGIEFLTESVEVTVYGRKSLVEPLVEITGVLQLADAGITEPGEYDLVVEWRPRGGVSVISEASVVRVLMRVPEPSTGETNTSTE